jgi:SERRATE/Ars2, N-terminal domain
MYREYAAPPPPALIAPNIDDRDIYDKQLMGHSNEYPAIFVSPSRMVHMKPIMTYGNFVKSQREDLSPEIYQKRYQDYQYNYLLDMADKFFTANLNEEWFRDRYDPSRILDRERRASEWSILESEMMKNAITENPLEILKAVSLEPVEKRRNNENNSKEDIKIESDSGEIIIRVNIIISYS